MPFKFKDIRLWWPNRPKSKDWLQNSTKTTYKIYGSKNAPIQSQTVMCNVANNKKQLKQYNEVFYDPKIKCYDGNGKVDKNKSESYTLSNKDYVKYHKFQEKQDQNYKHKNKNTFYVENVKYSQNKSKKKRKKKKKLKTVVSAIKNEKKESKVQNPSDDNEPSLNLPKWDPKWNEDFEKKSEVTKNNSKINVIGVNKVFDASHKYIDFLETIIYGYLRLMSTKYNIIIPTDIKRLCYLWYHPNTIYLTVISKYDSMHMSIGIIPTETILDLKQKIKDISGVEIKKQILIQMHLGKTLLDKFHVADYNLHDNDVLQLQFIYNYR